jgi:hypothetical protein
MRADDEGFINNAKKICRTVGANEDELSVLIAKSFIIIFDSNVIVIKHWWMHNYIRSDRIRDTAYQDEKNLLEVKQNGTYTFCPSTARQVTADCTLRIEENRVVKNRVVKNRDMVEFDQFWKSYPNKVAKTLALKAFEKAIKKTTIEVVLTAIATQKQSEQWLKDGGKFIPHPTTWLNQERWTDELKIKSKTIDERKSESDQICDELEANGIDWRDIVNGKASTKLLKWEYVEHKGFKWYLFERVPQVEVIDVELDDG